MLIKIKSIKNMFCIIAFTFFFTFTQNTTLFLDNLLNENIKMQKIN